MFIDRTAFFRKPSLFIATLCVCFGVTANANALLLGQSVFGNLNFGASTTNLFDPANIGLSQGALNELSNPVIVSATQGEFTHVDNGVIGVFLQIRDDNFTVSTDVATRTAVSWSISLTSAAFVGLILTETSDNFVDGGVSGALAGNTLTLNWGGTSTRGFYQANFDLTAPVTSVPEPGVLPLMGLGLAGLGFAARLRRRRKG